MDRGLVWRARSRRSPCTPRFRMPVRRIVSGVHDFRVAPAMGTGSGWRRTRNRHILDRQRRNKPDGAAASGERRAATRSDDFEGFFWFAQGVTKVGSWLSRKESRGAIPFSAGSLVTSAGGFQLLSSNSTVQHLQEPGIGEPRQGLWGKRAGATGLDSICGHGNPSANCGIASHGRTPVPQVLSIVSLG